METRPLHFHSRLSHVPWWPLSLITMVIILIGLGSLWYLSALPQNRIAAGVTSQNTDLSFLSREEADAKISAISTPEYNITVSADGQELATTAASLGLRPHASAMVEQALAVGRTGNFLEQRWNRLRLRWTNQTVDITPQYIYDSRLVQQWTESIKPVFAIEGRRPQASYENGTITIDSGERGQRLDQDELIERIEEHAGKPTQIMAPIEVTHVPLSADGRITAEDRLASLQTVTLRLELSETDLPQELTADDFFPWLRLPTGYHREDMTEALSRVTANWNRDAINAVFEYNKETNRLENFSPHRPGRVVQMEELADAVQQALSDAAQAASPPEEPITVAVPVSSIEPEVSLESTNDFGIKERIGYGTSTFYHSIPNRVFNVQLASERVHATLVAPGEEFSFNRSVGEVSRRTGYKTAYVISGGRTVLGDGGGVCQVSTTVFRAAMDAGFPFTAWKPHSYRVGYYEQNQEPGYDATVYAPSVDLKFRNDTDHHIVIASTIDVPNRHLVVEIWGTDDGRTAETANYRQWNSRSAPAPQYIDEPSLPAGTTRQIDWASPGLSTSFEYTVTNPDGSIRYQRDFTSHFRPWQAVYLVGTGG